MKKYRANVLVTCTMNVIVEAEDEDDARREIYRRQWKGTPTNVQATEVRGLVHLQVGYEAPKRRRPKNKRKKTKAGRRR